MKELFRITIIILISFTFKKSLCLTVRGDITKCFHCGGELQGWRRTDVSWTETGLRFPYFVFVRYIKGEAFIRDCWSLQTQRLILAQTVPLDVTSYQCTTHYQPGKVSSASLHNNEYICVWSHLYFLFCNHNIQSFMLYVMKDKRLIYISTRCCFFISCKVKRENFFSLYLL